MIRLRARCAAAGSILLLLLGGCRSAEPASGGPDPRASDTLRVVVAPMNIPIRLAPDLEDAVDRVTQELILYLQSHGARVSVIYGSDAWSLWRESEAALAEERQQDPDATAVASVFSRALASETPFDLLVLPSLVYREARVVGRWAEWDGVRRRVRFRVRSEVPVGRADLLPGPVDATDRGTTAQLTPDYRGQITGISLHALVFTPQGVGVLQGLGGLDLIYDAVQRPSGSGEFSLLRLQSDLLGDQGHVREGVAHALEPLLDPSRGR